MKGETCSTCIFWRDRGDNSHCTKRTKRTERDDFLTLFILCPANKEACKLWRG
jgi:hypothetical protein